MCKDCNSNKEVFVSFQDSSQNKITVSAGEDITVEKTVNQGVTDFKVSYSPYIPLVINSFSQSLPIQLKGVEVTSLSFNFSFDRAVEAIRIESSKFSSNVIVTPNGTSNYSNIGVPSSNINGGSITSNTSFSLYADDILGDNNNEKSKSTSLVFGNTVYVGTLSNVDENTDESVLVTSVQGLPSVLDTERNRTFTCTGDDVDEYEIVAYPVSFGAGTFQDSNNPAPGGFYLIGTYNIPNSAGFSEPYYIYRSSFGNLNGAIITVK